MLKILLFTCLMLIPKLAFSAIVVIDVHNELSMDLPLSALITSAEEETDAMHDSVEQTIQANSIGTITLYIEDVDLQQDTVVVLESGNQLIYTTVISRSLLIAADSRIYLSISVILA